MRIALFLLLLAAGLVTAIFGGLMLAPAGHGRVAFDASVALAVLVYIGLLSWYFFRKTHAPSKPLRLRGDENSSLRSSLAAAFADVDERLRAARGKPGVPLTLDALPWLLVVADSHGAGNFLRYAARHSPLPNPRRDNVAEAPRGRWFVAPEFAALEVDFAKTQGQARAEFWAAALGLLAAKRTEAPVDGIVSLVALDTLQLSPQRISDHGTELGRISDAAADCLGRDVPVMVVVTRCDRVPGIGTFAARLGGKSLTRAVGWWPEDAGHNHGVDEATVELALDGIDDRLRAVGLALVGREANVADKALIWACCEAWAGLRQELAILLKAAFLGRPAARLGGIFLVGDSIPGTMSPDIGLFVDDLARCFFPRLGDIRAAHAA